MLKNGNRILQLGKKNSSLQTNCIYSWVQSLMNVKPTKPVTTKASTPKEFYLRGLRLTLMIYTVL